MLLLSLGSRPVVLTRNCVPGPPYPPTAPGFFHTGDLASRDDRGRYQVLGRVKSTRALAGGNVIVPDHVENVFQASSFVRQVRRPWPPTAPHLCAHSLP